MRFNVNLWHDLVPGPKPPDTLYVVVEAPKTSRNKYEYSKTLGHIQLNRVLYSPLHFPGDYGFIPQTFSEDNDPLDVLVMTNNPTFPGCVIQARPIGMFKMIDKGELDYKILAVPADDPLFDGYWDVSNVPLHFPKEMAHFFMTYKQLEGTEVTNEGWAGVNIAKDTIQQAIERYQEHFGGGNLARLNVSSGTRWETLYGYSRAVRTNNIIHVAGTVGTDDEGQLVGIGDVKAQARQCYEKIKAALEKCGGSLADVVRVRTYVVRREDAAAAVEVMAEYLKEVRPAATLVVVASLLEPEMLIEIEVDAVLT